MCSLVDTEVQNELDEHCPELKALIRHPQELQGSKEAAINQLSKLHWFYEEHLSEVHILKFCFLGLGDVVALIIHRLVVFQLCFKETKFVSN